MPKTGKYPSPEPSEFVLRDRLPTPSATEKAERRMKQEAEAAIALAEVEERQRNLRANMERLKSERLARKKE